jgi:hypothetical protein
MEHQRNCGTSATRALFVVVSLGLNVFLAIWLLRHESARASTSAQSARNFATPNQHASTSASPKPVSAVETNLPVPFHWSEIESGDYRQYIANLRAIGCPEQTIRDIILADVGQLFGARVATVWQRHVGEYWQKYRNERPDPASMKQIVALSKEHNAVLRDLLGDTPGMQGLIDRLYLQITGNEQALLFLPPDKRDAAANLLSQSDFDIKDAEMHARGWTPAEEKRLFDEKAAALAEVLSPEELEEFKLRNSPTAKQLQMELEYFNCTPDEFKKFVALRDQNPDGERNSDGERVGRDMIDRTAATAEARSLFGDERAKEFERVTDMFYINTRRAAEKQGIALDQIDQAWQVTRDARTSAKQIANNNTLSADERRRQMQELLQQSESQLVNLLGDKASSAVRRDLRTVVNTTRAGIH